MMLVITSLGVGGAERLVTGLADRFAAAGHEVVLVVFHGEIELRPAHPGVRVVNLRMRRSPWGVLAALVRFRRLVRAFRPDVVNSHLVHANILSRLLRLVTPMPRLVSSAHNTNEEGRGRMIAYRLTDRLADISTNVSAEAVEAFERQGALRPGRMIAIHNGIDTAAFAFDPDARERVRAELTLEAATPLLLAVGRLWEQKDYSNLLRAFARLAGDGRPPRLAIVGDGPLRAELEGLADSLGVTDRVRFLGIRHDVPALMAACDLFVLSSAWEGFGLVVAEAMACERPVVATDCGGVREVVGDAGFLVPPR
ncbi:MAG: glycosyltransferase [Arhodomonas sp.]|nr:glycosyltransferase [Arhodomonas sp.]